MDDKWFKAQLKLAGITAEEVAQKVGRDRSNVSHIFNGRQKMTMEWAEGFASVLNLPLDEVMRRAGLVSTATARKLAAGFAEGDAVQWRGKEPDDPETRIAAAMGGGKPGIDVWRASTRSLELKGILPGDFLLADTHQALNSRAGDIVIAQRTDWHTGTAATLVRCLEPPVLVSHSLDPELQRVHVVDGETVMVRAKIIGCWRRP